MCLTELAFLWIGFYTIGFTLICLFKKKVLVNWSFGSYPDSGKVNRGKWIWYSGWKDYHIWCQAGFEGWRKGEIKDYSYSLEFEDMVSASIILWDREIRGITILAGKEKEYLQVDVFNILGMLL